MVLSKQANKEMSMHLAHRGPVLEDNLDIIINILLYLPIKSIGRFMIVCKSWNEVIHKRFFIEMQLSRSLGNPIYIVIKALVQRPTPTIDRPLSIHSIIASWNGLVCKESLFSPSYLPGHRKLSICNPVTDQTFEIPEDSGCSFCQETCLGVAFGPQCDDYRVYKFVRSPLLIGKHECRMYSSITECWKSLGLAPCFPLSSQHVFVNGTVYWQIHKGRENFPGAIMSVDSLDNFHTFDIPEIGSGWPHLVSLGSCLGLVVIYKDVVAASHMSIWVLDMPLPTWTKKLETDIPLPFLDVSVSAAASGNLIVVTTCMHYLTYHMDKRMWSVSRSVDGINGRTTFSGFFTESLLSCNGIMEP
uniref:F-box domain-containing protein n=1 Tax=Kalanchoe fedtschenkoi TaxID=63787 RepID=A0A7N0TYE9_KALFE